MGLNEQPIYVTFANPIQGVGGVYGSSGTSGTSGGGGEVYTSRLDSSHTPLLYAGEAAPSSAEADAVWRIWRVDISTGSTKLWANGSASFTNKWTERLILPYS